MAYLVDITTRCSCGKPATVELRNLLNSSLGKYCKTCGSRALRQQKREEDRAFRVADDAKRLAK